MPPLMAVRLAADLRPSADGSTVRTYVANANVSVNVNMEFMVTLHEQVRYRGTLQY